MPETHKPDYGYPSIPRLPHSTVPGTGYIAGMLDPVEIGLIIRNARDLKGMSQEDVADIVGGGQSTIGRIENGEFKRLPSVLPAIMQLLDIPPDKIDLGIGPTPAAPAIVQRVLGAENFRVYASAEGGPGEVIVSTDPIDIIPRPSIVANIREAYGILVTGTSMFPEYRHGETAIVNPLLPPQPGEVHIFYADREGSARATIKELRRSNHEQWFVSQHNPPEGRDKDFLLPKKDWRWVHRVLGKYSRR